MSKIVTTGEPQDFTETEREEFALLVKEGGEVSDVVLRRNIERARRLVFMRTSETLIGIAALKIPKLSYRARIGRQANVEIPESRFPFELGYVFVVPPERRKGLSYRLVEALLHNMMGIALYATSRTDNISMQRTLEGFEFRRAGRPYPGRGHSLQLFLRESH